MPAPSRSSGANTLDSDESGLPVVQRDIVQSIVERAASRELRLGAPERGSPVPPTSTHRLYEVYLRGMSHLHKGTPQDRVKGLVYLRKAVDWRSGKRARVGRSGARLCHHWPRASCDRRCLVECARGRRAELSSWIPTRRRHIWRLPASRCTGTSTGREPRLSSGVPTSSTRALPRTDITMLGTS